MARRGESIFKRKDGRWEGRYIKGRNLQGKAVYGYVYGSSYGKAREKLRIKAAGVEANPPGTQEPVPAAVTFGELAESWLAERRPNVKESTYIKYRNLLRGYILPRLGASAVPQITADTLQAFYRWLVSEAGRKKQGLSAKTAGDVFSVVRSILRCARLLNIPTACTGTEVTLRAGHREMHILSTAEQERLVQCLTGHPSGRNLGVLLCLYTGIRLGELCALRWEDVSESENTVRIHRTIQRLQRAEGEGKKTEVLVTAPKSPCSVRLIPIPPALLPLLNEFRREAGYFLTGTERYVEPRTMENHFKRVLRQAGVSDTNFHCLRHTFATRCVEAGFDIKTLSEILGHANIGITMDRYVHPTLQMKRENMARLTSPFLVR